MGQTNSSSASERAFQEVVLTPGRSMNGRRRNRPEERLSVSPLQDDDDIFEEAKLPMKASPSSLLSAGDLSDEESAVRVVGDQMITSLTVTDNNNEEKGDGDPIVLDEDDVKSPATSPKQSLPSLKPLLIRKSAGQTKWKKTEATASNTKESDNKRVDSRSTSPSSSPMRPHLSTLPSSILESSLSMDGGRRMMGNSTVTFFEHQKALAAAEILRNQRASACTLRPNAYIVKMAEIALFLALIYTAIVTPAEVAFVRRKDFHVDALFLVNQAVNLIFIFDICINFQLHYEDPVTKEWIRSQWSVAKHYAQRFFIIDLIASFPYDIVGLFFRGPIIHRIAALRLLRLLRLLKMIKIASSMRFVSRYRADLKQSFAVSNLLVYIVTTVMAAHWFACLWGFVGNLASEQNSWRGAFSDHDAVSANTKWSINAPKNQYVISLYFAIMTLTTVGYGDVNPTNLSEYALVTGIMFAGAFLWAYVIGSVCGTVATLDLIKIQYQQRYDQINGMLLDVRASHKIARKVRTYLFHTEKVSRHVEYATLIDHLSPGLQRELCNVLAQGNVAAVHYLKYRSTNFRLAIFKRFKTRLYCPQEEIETKDLILIKNSGVIKRIEPLGFPKLFIRGMALNVDFVLRNPQLLDKRPLQAGNFVEVNTLSRWALEEVMEIYPRERPRILWMNVFFALGAMSRRDSILQEEKEDPSLQERRHERSDSVADLLHGFVPIDDHSNKVNIDVIDVDVIDDIELAVEVCRSGNLHKCSVGLRDTRRLAEISVSAVPETFCHASLRLRGDPDFILWSVAHCGDRDWKRIIFPYIEPIELQRLLGALCFDAAELERRKNRNVEKRITDDHSRDVAFRSSQEKRDYAVSGKYGNSRINYHIGLASLHRHHRNRRNLGSKHQPSDHLHKDGHLSSEEHKVHHRTRFDVDVAPDDDDATRDYDESSTMMLEAPKSANRNSMSVDDVALSLFDS